ncbi:MAG: protein phosphatase 2C domain-containing protein [Gammaproteobacteria bacterium]|nr:protein phosphatase 2C domain-containing protein [Gammaproteobacteria bacterium]
MKFHIAQANRLGNRNTNQDRFEIIESDGSALMVLADGMGGRPYGEFASQLVVDIARHLYRETGGFIEDERDFLESVISNAHDSILELAEIENMERTPGTTVVLALLQDDHVCLAHVGDSRFYLLRNGEVLERTKDHSQVEELYRKGKITQRQVRNHPNLNQITRCVGCQDEIPEIEFSDPIPLDRGDIALLCSDGLWGSFEDEEIAEHMGVEELPLSELTQRLASMAEQSSYPNSDNVSVITLKIDALQRSRKPDEVRTKSDKQDGGGKLPLESAIEQLQQVMAEYEDEIKSKR